MEIRRIEGIFLQHALETAQGLKAENLSKQMSLRLLTTVPEALFNNSSRDNLLEGRVLQAQGRNLRLLLNNNQEILAENLSDLEVKEGDRLELVLESKNPITLKVVSLQRKLNAEQVLQFLLDPKGEPPISLDPQKLQTLIRNSGIFYERKLLDLFMGKEKLKNILEDAKAQLLINLFGLAEQVRGGEVKDLKIVEELFKMVLRRTEHLREVENLLRTLYLENLNHWEFTLLVRAFEGFGKREILKALEKGDKEGFLVLLGKELRSLENIPVGKSLSLAFERLKLLSLFVKDEELGYLLKGFVEAVEKGDTSTLREIHRRLESFLEEGRKLLPLRERIEKDGLTWLQQLSTISQMQRFAFNEGTLVIPFKWEGHRGGIAIRTQGEEYRIFINLNYPEGFVGALLSSPKLGKVKTVSLSLYTNSEDLYKKMEEGKTLLEGMLKEEGVQLRNLRLRLLPSPQSLKEVLKESFYEESFYLVV